MTIVAVAAGLTMAVLVVLLGGTMVVIWINDAADFFWMTILRPRLALGIFSIAALVIAAVCLAGGGAFSTTLFAVLVFGPVIARRGCDAFIRWRSVPVIVPPAGQRLVTTHAGLFAAERMKKRDAYLAPSVEQR